MKQMKPQLSSFNVFSFKTEAEMIVWIKFQLYHLSFCLGKLYFSLVAFKKVNNSSL